jgi:hypothetical protein
MAAMICPLPTSARPLLTAAAVTLCLAAPARTLVAQAAPFGPLTSEEGGPLQRVSYTPMMERADLAETGGLTADVWLGYSNIFEQDSAATHVLFMDLERLITTTTVRYGVSPRLEIGGRFTLETTGGGILDSFISWWHTNLHLGNANRERYPKDGYSQKLVDGEGQVRLDAPNRTLALEDVRFFAKWRLYASQDGHRLLSLRGVARIPTQDNRVSEERADVALMLLGRSRWGRVHLHGMVGGSTVRSSSELDPILRSRAAFMTLAAEYPLLDWVSGVVQYSVASPTTQGFDHRELDSPPMNLVFGFAGRLGENWRWDASFQEDIPPNSPAVDFTLGVRVSRSW